MGRQHKEKKVPVELSALQIKERKDRTLFVGNVPVDASAKQIKKLFIGELGAGKIEKVWFRSQATIEDSKKPERAKIIAGQFNPEQKDNKHAYVLLVDTSCIDAALKLNQEVFQGKHLRVDRAFSQREDEKVQNDFNTTIFIGNLPFVVSEEEVREHFAGCGTITNVRLVRDPRTFIGKGIGYVMFAEKEAMRKAVDNMPESRFKGRPLRVKKAVEPKRLEKKQRQKMEKAVEHAKRLTTQRAAIRDEKEAKRYKENDDDKEVAGLTRGKAFGDIMESDDSEDEDEKPKKKKNSQPNFDSFVGINRTIQENELKLDNVIALNKKKRNNMMKDMMEKGTHFLKTDQNKANAELFKPTPNFNEVLKKRIAKRREENIKKFKSVQGKVKVKVIKKTEQKKKK